MPSKSERIFGEMELSLYSLRAGVYEVELRVTDLENEAGVTPARGLAAIDFGRLKRAAVHADVFAQQEDVGVALHLLPKAFADRFQVSGRHGYWVS